MLKRKISDTLVDWKNSKNKECLMIMGARQIGKTYIVRHFGETHYRHYIEINFEQNPELKSIFDSDLSVDELIKKITLYMPSAHFVEGDTLLLLDEIQSCPQARTSLKFWADDNRFDVIATGSLLGLNYREVSSYPVGYERQISMYALDFQEFLWAVGISDDIMESLRQNMENNEPVDDVVNQKMLKYVREYMTIGGMPNVVNRYLETSDFNIVTQEQEKILASYLNDIAKYAPSADKPKARNCYLSLPKQLAKDNTKFQFSVVENKGTSRKYGNALDWLRDAGLISYCRNVTTVSFPLASYERTDQFRVYSTDIGLLIAMFGHEMKRAIIEDTLTGPAKGGIYENLIADFLLKKGCKLRYFCHDNSQVELEFILEKNAHPVPIEVKANKGKTTSLNSILKHSDIEMGYKFCAGNLGRDGKKITLPFYMAMFI